MSANLEHVVTVFPADETWPPLREPLWIPRRRLMLAVLPEKYRPWLLDPASLTERLIGVCPGTFRVRVISQGRARPMLNESRALGMRVDHYAVVRQVTLLCDGTPWVYARTVIPPQTLTGKCKRLAYLRSRSLGATLFADPSMERGEVEIARLTPADKLFARATQKLSNLPDAVWGRRSLFRLSGKPLLVCEFFLPTIGEFRF